MVDDARQRTKVYLDPSTGYLLQANLYRSDAVTPINFRVMYDFSSTIPIYRLLDGPESEKNLNAIYAIGTASSKPLWTYDHQTYGYIENVPITIYANDPMWSSDGEKIRWTCEAELRRVVETNYGGSLGVLRRFEGAVANPIDMGGWKLYSAKYNLEYKRANSNFTATAPTVSWGDVYIEDFDAGLELYGGSTITSSAGSTTTFATTTSHLTDSNDTWNGYQLLWLTGVNIGLTRRINDFGVTGGTATFTCDAFPSTNNGGDTFTVTKWTGWNTNYENGNVGTVNSLSVGDWIDINIIASSGSKVFSIQNDTVLGYATSLYPYIRYRFATTSGAKAKIVAVTTGGSETVIDETSSTTGVKTGTYTLTAGNTLNYIQLYANAGTGHVYYDFVELFAGTYTFPNCTELKPPKLLLKDANLFSPWSIGDITQPLGAESAECTMTCDLDLEGATQTWQRAQASTKTDTYKTDVFTELHQENASTAPWHWLNFGEGQMKARLISKEATLAGHDNTLTLIWREYAGGNLSSNTYATRFSIGT